MLYIITLFFDPLDNVQFQGSQKVDPTMLASCKQNTTKQFARKSKNTVIRDFFYLLSDSHLVQAIVVAK